MISRYLTQRPRPRKRKVCEADPQRHKVYDMERTMVGACVDTTMELPTLRQIVRHACREWGLIAPKLLLKSEDNTMVFGMYYHELNTICLNHCFHGANIGVLLHELAHHIIWRRHGHDAEDHGKEFVAVYRYLLNRYNVIPDYAFDTILDRWGVEYDIHYEVPR